MILNVMLPKNTEYSYMKKPRLCEGKHRRGIGRTTMQLRSRLKLSTQLKDNVL